jgi:hypothetical protein
MAMAGGAFMVKGMFHVAWPTGTVLGFECRFVLEDAIGSHACWRNTSMREFQ